MKSVTTSLCVSIVLSLAWLTANAQDTQPSATEPEGARTTHFRTFEATEEDRETFRFPGKISHEGGAAVYDSVCAGCHMPDGEGAIGAGEYPTLANNQLLAVPPYAIHLILEGQRAMPPLGEILDDQQVADVVNYIRSNFGNDFIEEYGEATAEEVAKTRQ